MTQIRLQKYLAHCGIGSRRTCETYIVQGRIRVDGIVTKELGVKVDPEVNIITFDKKMVKPEEKQWILLNKPPRYLCTMKDAKNRPLFLDLLPKNLGRLYPVGRLDYMSEGLLLVTNDGELAHKLTHPRYEITKTYEVTTFEPLSSLQMKQIRQGILCDGELLTVQSITHKNTEKTRHVYTIVLKEGRYRHIRRILKTLNIHIVRLKRTAMGPISCRNLQTGKWRFLSKQEINLLKQKTMEETA